jgi:hypothetical protein
MKNKKLAYILLPVVLLVWGIVGYKLYVKFFGEEDAIVASTEIVSEDKANAITDHFEIANNYRDPFLGNAVREAVVSSQPTTAPLQRQTVVIPPVMKPVVYWPAIKVGGIVNEKKFMGIISGKNVLLSKGEQALGVTFVKSSKDSVWFKFSNEQKAYPLK